MKRRIAQKLTCRKRQKSMHSTQEHETVNLERITKDVHVAGAFPPVTSLNYCPLNLICHLGSNTELNKLHLNKFYWET